MNSKKQRITVLIISILTLTIGLSFAYYSAVVQGTGNTNAETSANTATIGEVEFNGTSTFDSSTLDDIYPGFIGVQTFTISPYKNGSGIYEIDLAATVPEAFGNDIKLTLYKTSNKTNNNISREEGSLTINNNKYSKQDTLTINGTLTKVYEGSLVTTTETRLEQVEFVIGGVESTNFTTPDVTPDGYYTYYAVYEYINRETSQNNQQGLDFSSKISVKYVSELYSAAKESLKDLQALNPDLKITKTVLGNPDFTKMAPKETEGQERSTTISSSTEVMYGTSFKRKDGDCDGICLELVDSTTCEYSSCYQDLAGKYMVSLDGGLSADDYVYTAYFGGSIAKITSASSNGRVEYIRYSPEEAIALADGIWNPQTSGLYEEEDDYGTSIFFRGNITNNYVKFGGFYWRIIRINGDGSIRMIYAGDANTIDSLPNKLEVLANGYDDSTTKYTQIGESAYNTNNDDNAYVGYMYGTPGSDDYNDTHANINNSTIKTYIDNWYQSNISGKSFETYIADALFCNDRSTSWDATEWYEGRWETGVNNTAIQKNVTIYRSTNLVDSFLRWNYEESRLTCENKNDRFTISDTINGNGALTYPVGLITTYEANMAGGTSEENNSYYLKTGNKYYTMSPGYYHYYDQATVIPIYENGSIFKTYLSNTTTSFGVRPVINLKQGSITSGTGTASNPFTVE